MIDVLTDIPAAYYIQDEDLIDYTRVKSQRNSQRYGASGSGLGTDTAPADGNWAIDGWALDKYKFLPMIEQAWKMRSDKKWHFFCETDTYVVWDNLFRFIANLDHQAPYYMGSPSPGRLINDDDPDSATFFANGGPGFVLSSVATGQLLVRQEDTSKYISHRWLYLLRVDPCGDSILGWALHGVRISLSGFWPMFNSHPLHAIPFGVDHWCQPVLTCTK